VSQLHQCFTEMDISHKNLRFFEDTKSETSDVSVGNNHVYMAAPLNVLRVPILDKIPISDSYIPTPSFGHSSRSNYEGPSKNMVNNNRADCMLGSFPMKYGDLPPGGVKW
jgi:hypothetical protein